MNILFWKKLSKHNRRYLQLLVGGILVVLIPLAVASLSRPDTVKAAWFDDNWAYRQTVEVANTGSTQADFQISITLDTATLISAGKMESDCADIRIVDGNGKPLPYWIEEQTAPCNNATTRLWTKISSIPSGGITLFIYYGNPTAKSTAVAGGQIFEFFEDFNGGSINTNVWAGDTGSFTQSGGVISTTASSKGLYATNYTFTNGIVESAMRGTDASSARGEIGARINGGAGSDRSLDAGYSFRLRVNSNDDVAISERNGTGFAAGTDVAHTLNTNTWYVARFDLNGSSLEGFVDGTSKTTVTDSTYASGNILINSRDNSGFEWNWVFVRKIASTMPSAGAPSNEEKGTAPIAYWSFNEGQGTTANDSTVNKNTGTLSGATLPAWQTEDQCINGKCLFFDGTTSNVTVANAITGVQTVSMWVRLNTLTSALIDLDGGTHAITVDSSGVVSATGFTSPTYYINGVAAATPTLTANTWQYVTVTTGTSFDSTSSLTIGKSSTTYLKGFIDEVKIYPYARTTAQIKSDYASRGSVKGVSAQIGSNSSEALSEGLVGYWKMDESATPSLDSSGNSNSGTWAGNTAAAAGKFGNGTTFDGNGDSISISDNNSLDLTTTGSVGFWIKYTSTPTGWAAPLWKNDSGTNATTNYGFSNNTSGSLNISGILGNGSTFIETGAVNMTTNTWSHIIMTWDGSRLRLYKDGALVQDVAQTITPAANVKSIGLGDSSGGGTFIGTMDEVRMYNRALSASEVRQLADWAAPSLVYFDFEDAQGSTLTNKSASPSAQNGTWNGTGANHWTTGKYGKAGNFNGTDDDISLANGIGGIQTVSFWAKPTSNTSNMLALSTGAYVSASSGTISATGFASPTIYVNGVSGAALQANVWNHVSVTTASPIAASAITVGLANSTYFTGQIDEVRIYNYARTQKQVISDMNAGHPNVGSPVGSALINLKFDDGFGNVASNSGNIGATGNAGLYNFAKPATTTSGWQTGGKFGKALAFDGSDDFTNSGNADALQLTSGTVTAWIKTSNAGSSYRGIVTKQNAYGMFLKDNVFSIYDWGASAERSSGVRLNDNLWHYVAFTFQSGVTNGTILYIDGLAKLTTTMTVNGQAVPVLVGAGSITPSQLFTGMIDEVKVYSYTLSADEIRLDMNRGSALVLGAISDTSGLAGGGGSVASNSASAYYCIPGDTAACNAPVGEWNFEDRLGGTVKDTSGNGYDGTWYGTGASHWTSGKVNKAGKFNGSDDYVSISDASDLRASGAFTVEFWTKPATANANNFLISKNTASGWLLYMDGNSKLRTNINGGCFGCSNEGPVLSPNLWYHIALTISGANGTVTVYVNGVSVGTSGSNQPTDTSAINIGRSVSSGAGFFNGIIDQVKMFNYARTANQIIWDYNRGVPVTWFKFDECQGTTIHDSVPSSTFSATLNIGGTGSQTAVGTCTTPTDGTGAWYNGVSGKRNYSMNFDGTDDVVSLTNGPSLSTGTISFWMKRGESDTAQRGLIDFSTFVIALENHKIDFIKPGVSNNYSNSTITDTTSWHHITVVATSGNVKIYIDGIQDTASLTPTFSQATLIAIGRRQTGASNYWQGQIDDVKIFNYALTASQIKTLFNNGAVNFAPSTGAP